MPENNQEMKVKICVKKFNRKILRS